jgi:hypothetical protein
VREGNADFKAVSEVAGIITEGFPGEVCHLMKERVALGCVVFGIGVRR